MNALNFTNATKANLIGLATAVLGIAVYLGLDPQLGGLVLTAIGALGTLFVGFTYKNSPKRLPDGVTKAEAVDAAGTLPGA